MSFFELSEGVAVEPTAEVAGSTEVTVKCAFEREENKHNIPYTVDLKIYNLKIDAVGFETLL